MTNNKIKYYLGSPTEGDKVGTRGHNIEWLRIFHNAKKQRKTVICFEIDNYDLKPKATDNVLYLSLVERIERAIDNYIKR